jgi:5,10-methylenetetrahydromethanopterin reductase
MQYSLGLFPTTLSDLGRRALIAENSGFGSVWVGDIQSTHPELYTSLTSIALSTTSARFGPGVTNPVTRDAVVTASALATLSAASEGRTFMGIGVGDSALHNIGLRPAKLDYLEAYIGAVRSLWRTGSASYRDRSLILNWWKDRYPIPVYIAAHGSRTLELAGRVADGAIIGTGFTPDAIEVSRAAIGRGMKSAQRGDEDFTFWYFSMVTIADDDETAIEQLATPLAALANLIIRNGPEGKGLPEELIPAFQEVERRYDFSTHAESTGVGPNARLIRELGLLDYMAERFAIAGTPDTVVRRLTALKRAGVENLWFTRTLGDVEHFLARWGEEVRPLLDEHGI